MRPLGRLPLARRIYDGEQPQLPTGHRQAPPSLSQALEQSVFFDIQVAKDLIDARIEGQGGGTINYAPRSDFGPMRPSNPDMWLEWGAQTRDGDGWVDIACALHEEGATNDGNLIYSLLLVLSFNGQPIQWLPQRVYLGIDADGRYNGQVMRDLLDDNADTEHVPDELSTELLTPEMALSLINCRNVNTAEAGSINIRRSGAQKRRGEKPFTIRYNTILLPGGGSEYDATSGTHRATALHRVRGHFKTFTAKRPLMGKHVGTYWWGWQLRGDPKHGIVISDYQLDDDNIE
jgi:hypothetical protein